MSASNNHSTTQLIFAFLAIVFVMATVHLGFFVKQTEFHYILIDYSILFGIYIVYLRFFRVSHFSTLVGLAVISRIILVFATPALSDDIYRFLWDGSLSLLGVNPMASTPSSIMADPNVVTPYLNELFPHLNSSDYFSVYPPLAQLTFLIAVTFAKSVAIQTVFLKVILLFFEVGLLIIIRRLLLLVKLPRENLLIYALNPLVIIEIMGNTHYEGVLLFFLLWSIWLSARSIRLVGAGFAMASSVASKLTSLMYLPLWLRYKGLSWSIKFYLAVGVFILIYWSPFVQFSHLHNFRESLNLYFQTFEFNASIYYIARWIGFQIKGYNMIADLGPLLSLIPVLVILLLTYLQRNQNTPQLLLHILISITVYLLCSTTVHPWYVIIPLGVSMFTSYRYAVLWSYVAVWSYSHYNDGLIEPRFAWLCAEYVLLILFIGYEARNARIRKMAASNF